MYCFYQEKQICAASSLLLLQRSPSLVLQWLVVTMLFILLLLFFLYSLWLTFSYIWFAAAHCSISLTVIPDCFQVQHQLSNFSSGLTSLYLD